MPSVLRRYTPPTCTLEIAAKGSPLSRWTSRPVLKQLRFQLSFDDPKLPSDQQVKVKGDRAQLEVLCETVDTYVQQFLNQPTPAIASPAQPRNSSATHQATIPDTAGIHLQPSGLLSHELWLGVLATESSGPVVKLSALQLFDLANALDEYAAESIAIPSLNRPAWLKTSPGWARIAAIAVLALGVSATVAKFVMDVSSPTAVQTASTTGTDPGTGTSSDRFLSPSEPTNQFPDVANLPDASKTSPPPLGNLEPLPPPPAPGSAQPTPPAFPSVVVPQRPTVTAPPPAATRIAPPAQPAPSPSPTPQPQASSPAPNQAPVTLSLPSEGSAAASNPENQAEAARSPLADIQEIPTDQTGRATQQAAARGTAFDSIPQIAEIRGYFQERWQPPDGLTQTLEYRLLLNSDGSIQQITPLGQAAGTYVDRTNMPLIGEPFVSPVAGGQTPQIRLVLRPDGGVQTFADPGN